MKKLGNSDVSTVAGEYVDMSFEKIDDHTLEIILEKSVSPLFFLPKIANHRGGQIVSQKAIQAGGYEGFIAHPVGTGPFMFQEYVPKEKCVLTAHAGYFRGTPKLAGVEMYFIPDNDTREAAFKTGEMDLILGVGKPAGSTVWNSCLNQWSMCSVRDLPACFISIPLSSPWMISGSDRLSRMHWTGMIFWRHPVRNWYLR